MSMTNAQVALMAAATVSSAPRALATGTNDITYVASIFRVWLDKQDEVVIEK